MDKRNALSVVDSTILASINSNYRKSLSQLRNLQIVRLVWLHSNINESDEEFKNALAQLRQIFSSIDTFFDSQQCISFLNQIKEEKVFIIVSDTLVQSLVPFIHDTPQIYSIYVHSEKKSENKQWLTRWTKVKNVFTKIESICNLLKRHTEQSDRESISITLTSTDLNSLDPSFMYTQLLKEVFLEIPYNKKARKELADFLREQYCDNQIELAKIEEFEQNYEINTPIWWYTRECFTYRLLNLALRTQDVGIIMKMGFFLRDVHKQIAELHMQNEYHSALTVYRGQGIPNSDFERIKNGQNSLLAFNCFLSTSTDRDVSLLYADSARGNPHMTGILFKMTIDPNIASTPFASVKLVTAFADEEEILFSMHTVFRVLRSQLIEERLWQVDLALTVDDDHELKRLTEHFRQEINGTGWERLGKILIQMGSFDKAEHVYQILLEHASIDDGKQLGHLYHMLGMVNEKRADYQKALQLYFKALQIQEDALPQHHPDLGSTNSNIGHVYYHLGEYSKALAYYHKDLEISLKSFQPNHPSLTIIYTNIGQVYDDMGEYSNALEFYYKTLEIQQNNIPSNHPELADTYNSLAGVYDIMCDFPKALEFYQKSLEIQQRTLPANHQDLGVTYNNIGLVHDKLEAYPKALEFYQKTLDIFQKCLPSNHPDIAGTYNNIASVYDNMREYSKALEFYQKSLDLKQQSLTENHPDLAAIYNNIGLTHMKMDEYSMALNFYQQSLEIKQRHFSANHPTFAITYNNIGRVHTTMGEYSEAFKFYERAIQIGEHSLPENHPHLLLYRKNLAEARKKL